MVNKKYQRSKEGEQRRVLAIKKACCGKKQTQEHKDKMVETRRRNNSYKANLGSFKKGQISHNKGKTKENYEPLRRSGNTKTFHYGKENWNWKGGISTIYDKIKKSKEYKQWRKQVYENDFFACQSCGYKGKQIVAHHIYPFADYPDLRFEVENGITLCRACHLSLHATKITGCS